MTADQGMSTKDELLATAHRLIVGAPEVADETSHAGTEWRAAAVRWSAGYGSLLSEAEATVQVESEPALPEGIFGRVEMPGWRQHTGWITEETRYGAQVAVVRDWDGNVLAMVGVGPACRVLPLPTPLKRPDAPAAITAGGAWAGGDADEDYCEQDPR